MESVFNKVEEGGLVAYASLDVDKIRFELTDEVWDPCPECGKEVIVNGRCKTCPNCGWSTCYL